MFIIVKEKQKKIKKVVILSTGEYMCPTSVG